jgi:hypothetical protein
MAAVANFGLQLASNRVVRLAERERTRDSDGSAAYVAPDSSATKLKVVRVLPCSG